MTCRDSSCGEIFGTVVREHAWTARPGGVSVSSQTWSTTAWGRRSCLPECPGRTSRSGGGTPSGAVLVARRGRGFGKARGGFLGIRHMAGPVARRRAAARRGARAVRRVRRPPAGEMAIKVAALAHQHQPLTLIAESRPGRCRTSSARARPAARSRRSVEAAAACPSRGAPSLTASGGWLAASTSYRRSPAMRARVPPRRHLVVLPAAATTASIDTAAIPDVAPGGVHRRDPGRQRGRRPDTRPDDDRLGLCRVADLGRPADLSRARSGQSGRRCRSTPSHGSPSLAKATGAGPDRGEIARLRSTPTSSGRTQRASSRRSD